MLFKLPLCHGNSKKLLYVAIVLPTLLEHNSCIIKLCRDFETRKLVVSL